MKESMQFFFKKQIQTSTYTLSTAYIFKAPTCNDIAQYRRAILLPFMTRRAISQGVYARQTGYITGEKKPSAGKAGKVDESARAL